MELSEITSFELKIAELIERMSLEEKIGQLCLVNSTGPTVVQDFGPALREGKIGGIINEVDSDRVNRLQRIAVDESRNGIPLLIGRDVIHGFKTVFPIPLGQAASWNPELVQECARRAAIEASAVGINWTFAPMMDICRDPRWGRIAETLGEDPYLTSVLAQAMIRGFQGEDLADDNSIAACAKHFAGYGASEAGRDYNSANLPLRELRNVHLPPFRAAIDAGVASLMTSFSEIDGLPATANDFLLRQILRDEWRFDGMVVSDWNSVAELATHGLTTSDKDSAFQAASAGVDMEMTSRCYANHLPELIEQGKLGIEQLDRMVANILRVKFRLGLFEQYQDSARPTRKTCPDSRDVAYTAAVQSIVLLKNENDRLPLNLENINSLAVIGPLADDKYEQMGTWVFDGEAERSVTPLAAIRKSAGDAVHVKYAQGMEHSRSQSQRLFSEAVEIARAADVVIMCLGEEAILSGEAHCRADISLPGCQEALIEKIAEIGKPLILVIMAGRPLDLHNVIDKVDALLYAWHPGNMAGPAIADLLFGRECPSGKLPATFPRMTGQIPIYYSHKNTGRPARAHNMVCIEDIEPHASQHSVGDTSFHIDAGYTPLFPFGFGLSYTTFQYSDIRTSAEQIPSDCSIDISATVANIGAREGTEVVQLYIRDLVGSVTRPVRELKRFTRITLMPGESRRVSFTLGTDDLAFYGREGRLAAEPGEFHAWIGGNSDADLQTRFTVTP